MRDLKSELSTLYIKLAVFYFFLIFDLIWSSFIEPSTSVSPQKTEEELVIYWMSALHIIIVLATVILFCTLIWQTQPLKLGMLRVLMMDFLYVFLISGIMLIIVIVERLIIITNITNANSYDTINYYWSNSVPYQILYYLRYILHPLYIFIMLNGSLKVVQPYYHMRNPQLFLN